MDPPATWPPPRCRPADLERPVDTLPGVGKTIRARLAKLGLHTVRDLLEHAPFRYVGASPISSLFGEGGEVSIEGTVGRVSKRSPRRRMSIVEATVSDDSGQIRATWFNQPWVAEQLRPGMRLRLIGSVRRGTFAVRTHEPASEHADLVPVYPASEDVTPKKLRELVLAALPRDVADPLPAALKQQEGCRRRSMRCTHCTGRARSRRPNGHAYGSRSTSCSYSSSASRAAHARARRRWRRHSASPESCSSGTAPRFRSS